MNSVQDKFLPKSGEMEFITEQEPWSRYKLENGTIVRVRIVMTRAEDSGKVLGPDNCADPKSYGLPLYNLQWQQIVDVQFPDDIKEAAAKKREQSQ